MIFDYQKNTRDAYYDMCFVSIELRKLPKILDKYDLMVTNGILNFILSSVAKSEFSKQWIIQLKGDINFKYMQKISN